MKVPHTRQAKIRTWPRWLTTDPDRASAAILGMPDDMGVAFNFGRPGAREGPTAIREKFIEFDVNPSVLDCGDVIPHDEFLEETHDRVTKAASRISQTTFIPIGLGGGHDLTFPFVRGVADRHGKPLAGVYVDPHLDVRERIGSGMPFRRLIEGGYTDRLDIYSFDPACNSADHADWFRANGGTTHESPPINISWPDRPTFVSFDMDCIRAEHAPGVSAVRKNGGVTPEQALSFARDAGRQRTVVSFDIMEVSPIHDAADGRTAHLAAAIVVAFLEGIWNRGR